MRKGALLPFFLFLLLAICSAGAPTIGSSEHAVSANPMERNLISSYSGGRVRSGSGYGGAGYGGAGYGGYRCCK